MDGAGKLERLVVVIPVAMMLTKSYVLKQSRHIFLVVVKRIAAIGKLEIGVK